MRLLRLALAATAVASGFLIAAPAPAALASWLRQPTPNIGSAVAWEFTAVSCGSPNICMAVGSLSADF